MAKSDTAEQAPKTDRQKSAASLAPSAVPSSKDDLPKNSFGEPKGIRPEGDFREVTMKGGRFTFRVANRFRVGQVLGEAEASFANAAMAEAIRGSFYDRLNLRVEEGQEPDQIEDAFYAHENFFQWSARAAAPKYTPLEAECRKIIREQLVIKIREAGQTLKDIPAEDMEAKITAALEKNRAKVEPIAQKRLAAKEEKLDLSLA